MERATERTTKLLVVEQELKGITAEMIDWWWDNMGTTERFQHWDPENHVSFAWKKAPNGGGRVGAIQAVEERIGEHTRQQWLRWDDPTSAPIPTSLGHVVVSSVLTPDMMVRYRVVHEYEDIPGGTRIRTTFVMPSDLSKEYVEDQTRHDTLELSRLPAILPDLYTIVRGYFN